MADQGPATAAAAGTIGLGGDLTVHRLGFGAMRITGDRHLGRPPDRDQARAVLRRAVELGVNFIDTADSYGPDVSEELIAEALLPVPRRPGHRHQGRARAARPGRVDRQRRPEHLARRATAACAGCAWSRSRCTSSTVPTRGCRSRTRSARWSS